MRWLIVSCLALAGFSAANGQTGNDKPVAMQAGQWESTIAVTNLDFGGLPTEQATNLRRQMGTPRTTSQCLTREQVANPLSNMANQQNCEIARSVFAGGDIDISATCDAGQGKARMTLTGTYTSDSFTAQMQVESRATQPVVGGAQVFRMSATLRGRRLGRCTEPAAASKPVEATG